MHRDLNIYTDAEDFKPERFLAEDGITPQMYPDTKDLGHHGFLDLGRSPIEIVFLAPSS